MNVQIIVSLDAPDTLTRENLARFVNEAIATMLDEQSDHSPWVNVAIVDVVLA